MVIYEVNLSVDNAVAEEAAGWLRRHIRDMLLFDGFEQATWLYEQPSGENQLWTIQYRVTTLRQLEEYLESESASMRSEAAERFGDRIGARRRVLIEREIFG